MAGEKMVWGIDVGQTALKALKLQLDGDIVEAVAFDIVEHAKPLNPTERGGEALVEALTAAIETLMSRNEMAGNPCVIGVPGYQAFTRFTKLPPVEKKQLPAIVQFEAGQQIPYEIDQVIWDYQIFGEEGSPDVEVGIFCMRTEQLDRYLGPFTDAGLQPVIVQPAPLALVNFIEHDAPRPDKATVLLDIGAESTDLIVVDRGNVWNRAVPIGGNNFTERLMESFKLEFPKAEALKRQAATHKYARQIFQAMRPVYQDLVSEIQRSVGRYTQTHRDAQLDKVVGMGNGFRLPGLQKFLQQNLGMKVERLSAFNQLAPGASLNAPTLNEQVLSLGVAYGLAIQGMGRGAVQSNLLPPQIAKRTTWRRKRPYFMATAACVLLAAGCLWARYLLDTSALASNGGMGEGVSTSMNRKAAENFLRTGRNSEGVPPREYSAKVLAAARSLTSEWNKLHSQVDEGKDEVIGIMTLLDDQTLWPKIVDLVHEALPEADASLVGAKTVEEYLKAAAEIPRQDRRQIFINSLNTRYSPMVAEEPGIAPPEDELDAGRGRGRGRSTGRSSRSTRGRSSRGRGGAAELPDREDGRGFVITLTGWTPNQYTTILDEFAETIKTLGNPKDEEEAEELGFHVIMPEKLAALQQRSPQKALRMVGSPKMPTAAERAEIDRRDPDRDPVTGEIWVKDWVFRIQFGIVLGPSPASEEAEDEERGGRRPSRGRR